MAVRTINISLDEKLLEEVDKAAKSEYSSRSDYIRTSLLKNIPRDHTNLDQQVMAAPKQVIKTYKSDFKNHVNR